jgi:hypothetical protein
VPITEADRFRSSGEVRRPGVATAVATPDTRICADASAVRASSERWSRTQVS